MSKPGEIEMKTRTTSSSLIALLLACLESLPTAQAVITDPEGYFPNWNTAEGQSASSASQLASTTRPWEGLRSIPIPPATAIRQWVLMLFSTTGQPLATPPWDLLRSFTTTTGGQNTATGYAALRSNSTGKLEHGQWISSTLFQHHRRSKTRPPVFERSITTPPARQRGLRFSSAL